MDDLAGWQLAVIVTVVLLGALVQGTVGFGFALVAAGPIGLIEPDAVPGVLLLLSLPINASVWARDHDAVVSTDLRDVVFGLAIGTPLGVLVLTSVSGELLATAFGSAIVAATAMSVVRPPGDAGVMARVLGGAASGVIGTVASTGGPPLALLFQHRPLRRFRATLAASFLIAAVAAIIGVALAGRIGGSQVALALLVAPALLAGLLLSGPAGRRIDPAVLRPAVLAFSAASGVAAILRGLL